MNADAVNNITLSGIVAIIVAVGVLSGFFGKFFSQIYKIKLLNNIEYQKNIFLNKKNINFKSNLFLYCYCIYYISRFTIFYFI